MINLLPKKEKDKLHREYRFRLAVVVLSVTFVILLVANIAVVPSFVVSSVKLSITEEQKESLENSESGEKRKELAAVARQANSRVSFLGNSGKTRSPSDALQTILDNKGANVALSTFLYKRGSGQNVEEGGGGKADPATYQVRGMASDRGELTGFRDRLNKSEAFSDVVLPVSNLVSGENIEFTMELKLSKRGKSQKNAGGKQS
jgi:hypothetical protein